MCGVCVADTVQRELARVCEGCLLVCTGNLLFRVDEASRAAVVERGSHHEVGRHLPRVAVDRLLARGKLAYAVEGDRRDAGHVVVRRAVAELPRGAAARVEDGERVGGGVGDP